MPSSDVVLLGLLPRGTGTGEGRPLKSNDHRWPSIYTKSIAAVNSRLK